jgi:endonuclease YncB( thermonuclease family)
MIRFAASARTGGAGLSGLDLAAAVLVLAGLIWAAAYLAPTTSDRLVGYATAIDGDSLRLDGAEIRLLGLDAPELHQSCMLGERPYACGEDARRELARFAASGPLTCEIVSRDRYARRLARCSIHGRDLGAILVERGLAVAYGRYAAEEERARRNRAGLWAGRFQRPAEWRKEHPRS